MIYCSLDSLADLLDSVFNMKYILPDLHNLVKNLLVSLRGCGKNSAHLVQNETVRVELRHWIPVSVH